ncbi:ABC transporter ATP-binding protein [Cumulibacter manganitolerans]|uniref:ABC transporter ATP-binding protein n=1 Tax=Cumulibacter manganitolerans TaxID=1884992 RepID=UPI001296CACC|nr:ABC transporter ATP-binding protein [Cumulibacter manganitolerans]
MSFLDAHVRATRERVEVDLPLQASAGSVLALLGPNGSGKSTALAVVAGLLRPAGGHVRVDGRVLHDSQRWLPPEQRRVGVVFQDGRLFGHLSALDNVAYGPMARGLPRRGARAKAREVLAAVGAEHIAGVRPRELSGGQAQRVALARALATDPDLLLLDEPLSALDAGSRIGVRADLRRYLGDFGGVAIVVTHDVVDATALADQVVVIEDGKVVQRATPSELVAAPRTRYVADLAGLTLLRGTSDGRSVALDGGGTIQVPGPTGPVLVAVHPHDVRVHPDASAAAERRNVWSGTVSDLEQRGLVLRVEVVADGGPALVSEADALQHSTLAVGDKVTLSLDTDSLVVYSQ